MVYIACSSERCRNQAEVLTKRPDGEFMPVWTFGLDGYTAEV